MGMIVTALAGGLGTILGAILIQDSKDWLGWLKQHCLEKAVSLLPVDQRERLREEWQDHVDDRPGSLAKAWTAFSLVWGARTLAQARRSAERRADTINHLVDTALDRRLGNLPGFIRIIAKRELRLRLSQQRMEFSGDNKTKIREKVDNLVVGFADDIYADLTSFVQCVRDIDMQAPNPVSDGKKSQKFVQLTNVLIEALIEMSALRKEHPDMDLEEIMKFPGDRLSRPQHGN